MEMTTTILKNDPTNRIWKAAFSSENGRRKLKQRFPSRFAEPLPGLSPADPRFQALLRDASELLDENIVTTPVNRFASSSGVAQSFAALRTACGVLGSPAGHVLYDNSIMRKDNGIKRDVPTERELLLLHELLDAMMEGFEPGPLKVAARSSEGMPRFSFDKEQKMAAAIRALEPKNLKSIFSHVKRRDGVGLLEEHNMIVAYAQNYRGSPDAFGKQRMVPSFEYAISGGNEGKLVEMDKRVFMPNGVQVTDLQANRARLVMGMNNQVNIIISTWRAGTARYYLNEYKYSWKHVTKEAICDDLNKYREEFPEGQIIGVDVGKFDATVPRWIRTEIYEYCKGRYISEEFGDFMLQAAFAPVFQPETGDGLGAVFHGDPLAMETFASPGLLSGFDMVSPEGKIINVWQAMVLIGYVMGWDYIAGNVKAFLKGHLSIRIKNAGDDGLLMFPNKKVSDKFFSPEIMDRSFLQIEPEASLVFIGYVFRDIDGKKIVAYNNVNSFPIKTFCPEKAWNSKLRQYWPIGLQEKMKLYANNPSYDDVTEILNWCFAKRMPHLTDWSTYANRLIVENSHIRPDMRNEFDVQFISDPETIHWKLPEELVSQHLMDEVYGSIPISAYEHMIGEHLLY